MLAVMYILDLTKRRRQYILLIFPAKILLICLSSDESLLQALIQPNIYTAAIYVLSFHLFSHPKYLIIHSSAKLFLQSVIHPSGISLSIHLTTRSAIYPFSQRAINSSNNQYNHSDSINLSTHRSSFQPPKHLIIQSSTMLSI